MNLVYLGNFELDAQKVIWTKICPGDTMKAQPWNNVMVRSFSFVSKIWMIWFHAMRSNDVETCTTTNLKNINNILNGIRSKLDTEIQNG